MRYANEYTIPQDVTDKVQSIVASATNIVDLPIKEVEGVLPDLLTYINQSDAKASLNDGSGMICVKFIPPEGTGLDEQILLSTAMFHLINLAFYDPAPEQKNNLPYTTFKSSADSPEKMKAAGVRFYTPNEKLGYHNDVFYQDGAYSIPKYVSLINLFIGYNNPGNLYYIHQKIWDHFNGLFERGLGKKFKFHPTPIVHESHIQEGQAKSPLDNWVDVPAFWQDQDGQKFAFANGELRDNDSTTLVSELKDSLLNNKEKIAIPQKTHQVMIFRNDVGFHSRDIFEGQYVFEGVTRLFLRSVSKEAILIPNALAA
jgi:hypothetical protein